MRWLRNEQARARLVSIAALGVDFLAWHWDGTWRWGEPAASVVIVAVLGGLVLAHLPAIVRPDRVWLAASTLWIYGVFVGLTVTEYSPFAGLCVALARLVAVTALPFALAALGAVALPFGLNATNTTAEIGPTRYPLLVTAPIWAALAIIPWGIGRASYRAAQRAEERTREREHLKEIEAREQLQAERLRLARELHDIVSHSVSAMTLQAAGARALAPGGDPRQLAALEAVEQTGVQAMRELHRLLGLLREVDGAADFTSESRVPGNGSVGDLDELLATVRACDIEVSVVTDGDHHALDPSIDHAAYRVVQESLANVAKHGGRAAVARVHLAWLRDSLRVEVRNAPGLSLPTAPELSGGLGLRGLAERVELVGGRFEAGPTGDGGFLVRAELPYGPVAGNGRARVPADPVASR